MIWQFIARMIEPATQCRGFVCLGLEALGVVSGLAYSLAVIGLSIYGFDALLLSALFVWHRRPAAVASRQSSVVSRQSPLAIRNSQSPIRHWPHVTVQLPIYNERYVVERLIDAACALDYPAERLEIQVLDDSTDDTTWLARVRVAHHRARGRNISLLHRDDRYGFKAGALAHGLRSAQGEFLAVFDADFVPPRDFLRRILPHFEDPSVGMVQARWGHLNGDCDALTQAQALMLDAHFVVEQVARSRSGLYFNFNGSAGVWRRACVEAAGGWQAHTIAEDLDLSYRAQLCGWRLEYAPEIVAPAEIPAQIMALKRQQFRWAKGSIQCLRRLWRPILSARAPLYRRVQGLLHLSTYLTHLMIIVMVIASLPLALTGEVSYLRLGLLGLAGLGPPALIALSQWAGYAGAGGRFRYFPVLVTLGMGLALNNTWAAVEAFLGVASAFDRTPKFRAEGRRRRVMPASQYSLPIDWTTWGELTLAVYSTLAMIAALFRSPALAPFLGVCAVGFAYVAGLGLAQSRQPTGFRPRRFNAKVPRTGPKPRSRKGSLFS